MTDKKDPYIGFRKFAYNPSIDDIVSAIKSVPRGLGEYIKTGKIGGTDVRKEIGNILAGGVKGLYQDIKDVQHIPVTKEGISKEDAGKILNVGPGLLAGATAIGGVPKGVGVFGGRLSKTFDKDALRAAQKAEIRNETRDKIYADTGLYRDQDMNWKYEIPDRDSSVKPFVSPFGSNTPTYLKDILHHPKLYEAYPDIGDIKILFGEKAGGGSHYPHANIAEERIGINPYDWKERPSELRDVLLHEAQHAIQQREGFALGSSPTMLERTPDELRRAQPIIDILANHYMETIPFTDDVSSFAKYKIARRKAEEEYSNLWYAAHKGEIEARNAQYRKDFSDLDIVNRPPWTTESLGMPWKGYKGKIGELMGDRQIMRFDPDLKMRTPSKALNSTAKDDIVNWLKEAGVPHTTKQVGDTTYIKYRPPGNEDKSQTAVTVRVPGQDAHAGRPPKPSEIGRYFDLGTVPPAKGFGVDPRTTENVSGVSYSNPKALENALKFSTSAAPKGENWLVPPDMSPVTRTRRQPAAEPENFNNPDQLKLLSGGVTVPNTDQHLTEDDLINHYLDAIYG